MKKKLSFEEIVEIGRPLATPKFIKKLRKQKNKEDVYYLINKLDCPTEVKLHILSAYIQTAQAMEFAEMIEKVGKELFK